jgi:nucleoid DNA-binding protein
MVDKYLIATIAESGIPVEDAEDMAERVFGAVLASLAAGRTVRIPGVCRLKAPRKPAWVPGTVKRQAVEQRKVAIMHPSIIEQGDPYDVAKPVDPQVASHAWGQAIRDTRADGPGQ